MFKGCCPVVNVPFNEDYSIDFESLKNEIDFIYNGGCKSICLFAFNSEPYKLSFDEKIETIKQFLQMVDKRMETLVGLVEFLLLSSSQIFSTLTVVVVGVLGTVKIPSSGS